MGQNRGVNPHVFAQDIVGYIISHDIPLYRCTSAVSSVLLHIPMKYPNELTTRYGIEHINITPRTVYDNEPTCYHIPTPALYFNGHDSGTDLLQVPTIYKAYITPKWQGISQQNMTKTMLTSTSMLGS